MKILKFILSFICYTLLIPICIALTVVTTWYILPAFQTTFVGEYILTFVNMQQVFLISIGLLGSAILFFILGRIFKVVKSSKLNNLYTHILTWLIALCLVAESLFIFFVSGTLQTASIELTLTRKIAIGAGVLLMAFYNILYKKLGKLIDRKIQAYDTAKELNANGRSSIIWVHFLKSIDFIFPEFILLLTLCFAFNFEISLYFIFIIASFIIPIIGNIVCDKRVRKEAIKKVEEEREISVNETAEAVADLLRKTSGGNI